MFMSCLASKSIDVKARKRIEQLYELTDEIIDAYNEINEKYVYQIYQKYQQLKETNRHLRLQLDQQRRCRRCRHKRVSNDSETSDCSIENNKQTKHMIVPSTSTITTRTKKTNRRIDDGQ
jgi:Mg2+ and Co2+ transporter CorA